MTSVHDDVIQRPSDRETLLIGMLGSRQGRLQHVATLTLRSHGRRTSRKKLTNLDAVGLIVPLCQKLGQVPLLFGPNCDTASTFQKTRNAKQEQLSSSTTANRWWQKYKDTMVGFEIRTGMHTEYEDLKERTKLPDVPSLIADIRHSLFGHICHLPDNTPASQALQLSIEPHTGTPPAADWCMSAYRHRCKKTFFTFFILVTFFTFFNVFFIFSTFFYFQVTLSKKHAADGYLNFMVLSASVRRP